MAEAQVAASVRLMPITGKYYETMLPNYGPQRIWKVLPGNEDKKIWGTPVPPAAAFALLMIRPDVVKLAPQDEGVDLKKVFTEEQLADLKSKSLYGYPVPRQSGQKPVAGAGGADSAQVKALQRDLEAQRAENNEIKAQLTKVTETLAKVVEAQNKAASAPPAGGAKA